MIKKIGFIIPSIGVGGAERVVVSLANALSTYFECVIFVQPGSQRHYQIDVDVLEIDFTKEGILNAVKEHKIDLLSDHFHWEADHVKVIAEVADEGVKVVLTEHNSYYYPLFQFARDRKAGYDKWFNDRYDFYKKFTGVILLNEDTHKSFRQHLDNIYTIPNPVPYDPSGVADYNSKRVLSASHFFKKAKRIDLLYAMQAKLQDMVPESVLTILGNYSWTQDQYYRRATGCRPDAVRSPGRTTRVEEYYNKASVFVMTSEIEGQPMVLLEAAMHALPQVCFDIPGLRDQIVDGVTGRLIPYGDVDALTACVSELLENPDRMREMGLAARKFVQEQFSEERVVDIWIDLIAEIDKTGRITAPEYEQTEEEKESDLKWKDYWKGAANNAASHVDPKISFLVPVYGTEAVLGRCLRSIQDQTLEEFECIVVDDASPGDVEAVMREAIGDDARFRIIHHAQNRGLYQARSTAADDACGLFFANIDSDDYIHPSFAEIMFDKAILTDSEIVECQAIELHADGRPIRFNDIQQVDPIDGAEANRAFLNNTFRNVVWNKIYARDLWRRVPEHNSIDVGLSITEDLLRNSLLFPACHRYTAVQDCLYYYCRRPTSVVTGGDIIRLDKKLKDIEYSYRKAKAQYVSEDSEQFWKKLEHRRIEDISWYVSEYLKRTELSAVWSEIWEKDVDPSLSLIISLVANNAKLDVELQHRWNAWRWELNRATRLENKLTEARKTLS